MEFPQHGHLLLDFLRPFGLPMGGVIPLHEVFQRGLDRGIAQDEIEEALIRASANGWIMAAGDYLRLTKSGFQILNPANDNSPMPPDT